MPSSAKALTAVALQSAIARSPLVATPETTVMVAATQMSQGTGGCSDCVVVVESERVVGLLTERDVVRLVSQECPLQAQTLGAVMTQPVVTLRESSWVDGTLDSAAVLALFQQHGIRHLPLVDAGDRLTGLLTDTGLQRAMIAAQSEAEARCRAQGAHYKAVVEAIPDLMFRVGADGCYRGLVTQGRSFDVVPPSLDRIGQSLGEVLPPAVAERHDHYLRQALETGELQLYEQQIPVAIGGASPGENDLQYEEVRVIPCGEDEVLFIVRDITAQKQTEVTLRQSEQLHRTLIETQPDLIIHMDRQGNYKRRVGGDAFRIRSLSKEKVATVYGVLPPGLAKQQLDYAHQALETGQLQTFEHDFEFEGQHHYEEVRIAPLNDQDVLIVVRDISEQTQLATERERATAALVESERRFRTLFENTPKLAVQGYDRDRRVIYWNSASETLYGYSAAEAIGQPIETLIVPPEARPQVVGRLENWAREKAIPAGEIDLVAKDGTKLTVFSNHITLTNRAGELEFYCVDIDLGPLKQAEHQLQALNQSLEATVAARTADLQEREQFLQTVLDTFPLAVFWKDQDSLYQGGNRNFLRHAGLGSITEIIGKRDDQLPWSEAEAEAYRQQDRQIMASGTPLMGIVETQMQADGHQVWIETNKLPLRNLAGAVIGVLGTYQDITDRHQAEAALIQSEARQRAILATLPDYLFCLGTDGVYRDLVTYQPEIALFPADFNPVGLAMSDVLPPDIATLQLRYLEEALATGTLQTYEQQVPLEDGIRDEEVRVIQSGPDEALFMIRDISERARLEAERKHAAAQLRRYERVVSATIDGIALVDCNYIYQLANPTYLHLTGKTQDQVVGQSVEAVLGEVLGEPFFRLQIQPNLARCLAGECIQYEGWFDFAVTGPRFMSVNYVPYRKLDGTIAGIVTNTRDITNLKQMQYTLGLATQQLQAFLINAPVMISHFDDEGRYFQVNGAFAEQVGRPIYEIVGRSFADLFPASMVALFQERVQRVAETQQPLEVEDEVCINGETKTFQTTLFAVKDLYQGRTMSFWAIAKEITDRKQAEAALKESEARWQFALEGAGDGVWDWNLQTNQVFFSHPWKAMLGFSDEEIGDSRQEWESRVHPDDLESCHDALQRHFRGEAPIYQREHRLRCRDGSYKWILTRGKVIEWGDQGQPLRMIGTHTDVSDRKQAETQLQEMTQRLTLATDSAQIGVWEWDVLADRLIWDDCMYALYGLAPADFGGVYGDWQRCLHPEDRSKADADTHAAISGEKEFHPEFRVVWPDGQVRFIQAHAIVLRDHAGTPQRMIGVNWDITDRKQAEAALQNLMIDTAATTGQDFFAALARHIATALAVPYTIVNAHKDGELQTLAFCAEGTLQPNFVYNSVHTPCERTLQAGHFYCADQVQHHFPEDVDLVMMEAQSYLGIAFQDAEGHTIGELCILDKKPLQAPQRAQQILQIFAARAAAELQRQRATDALEQLNQTLEARVTQRTAALREQQMRYRTLMEGASDAILVIDFQGNLIEANDQAERLLGYPKAELTAMHITQLRASEDAATVLAHFEQVTRQARSQVLDVPLLRQDGAFVSVDVSASVIDINGEPIVQAIFRDISDRKRFEAERQRAEQDLQRLVLELSDFKFALDQSAIVVTTDAKGVITYANDRFCEISGYDREAILGRTHRLVNSGHHPPKFFQDLWRTIASGQVWRGEICNRNKKGELYWVESTLVPFLDAQGKPFQYLTIRFDITDRKQAEQTIRKQAEREKLLRETGELIRQSLDLLTIFNTACQEIQAVLQSDRVSIFQFGPISEFLRGEFVAESAVAGIRSVLETPVEDHCFGENYSALYSQGRGFVSHDIHDQGLSPCHIDILAQFQVRACIVMPLLCGKTLWGLLCIHQCDAPRHWQTAEVVLAQRLAIQLAMAIQQANLYEQLQQQLAERQQAQQQLTERNQELALSNQELVRATRLKDEFLANMSHELRTPLNAILGMAEGLQEQVFGEVTPEQIKALQTIERGGTHLLALINDILDVAKIEAGQVELDCAATAIAPLCKSSLTFVKQQALKKRIQLTLQLPVDLPDLWGDERRIRQALINLLSNAVKFTPEGGRITLQVSHHQRSIATVEPHLQGITRVRIHRTAVEEALHLKAGEGDRLMQTYLSIAVIDTGIGIAAADLDKLFQPFVQIDSALNRQYNGTGLGLTLVKRLVELHGGQVSVTSNVGSGSCFSINLPCTFSILPRPDKTVEVVTSTLMNVDHVLPANGSLILLAEDNEANVSTISSYLKAKGYRIVVALNGEVAIALAQQERPDLILMDVQMPGMDGLEAMQRLRQDPDFVDIPIIALTALAMAGDRERCLAAGATEYLTKPVKLKQLAATIQQLLNNPLSAC